MRPRSRPGTCLLCRAAVSKKAALNHGEHCLQLSGWPAGLLPSFFIRIEDRHHPAYWLMVLARHSAQFSDLDELLRDVWMESGDEPGIFTIGKETINTGEELDIPLVNHLKQGSLFYYDYGSDAPTALRLRILGQTSVMPPQGPVCLIARNQHTLPKCSVCGDDAEFSVSDTGEDGTGEYHCMHCLMRLDDVYVQIIENSPRTGICASRENRDAAMVWYPPGWEASDIISPDALMFMGTPQAYPEDEEICLNNWHVGEEIVEDLLNVVFADIGEEIAGFFDEEVARADTTPRSGEIVMACCTILYGIHETQIEDWDAPLMRTFLFEDMPENPAFTDEWLENTVPLLCRFLAYMESAGRLRHAAALITALRESEPMFREIMTTPNPEPAEAVREPDADLLNNICDLLELIPKEQRDPNSDTFQTLMENIFGKNQDVQIGDVIRNMMITDRCEEYCTRIDEERIPERCRTIVRYLTAHPDAPLSRGDGLLWSGAIVYAACQEGNLLGRAKGGSLLAQDICEHFNLRLPSVRSKASVLNKYLRSA